MRNVRVCVAGGKGGTGKTFVATNLAYEALQRGRKLLLMDLDVENPSTKLLLRVDVERVEEFKVFVPVIDVQACTRCGACAERCPEHAIVLLPGSPPKVIGELCSGCGVCRLVCPVSAVGQGWRVEGRVEWGALEGKGRAVIGVLRPGSKRSVAMVVWLVETLYPTFSDYEVVVMDCPPGAGGAHVAVLRKSTAVVAVTEPTPLGLSDLVRFLRLSVKYVEPAKTVVVVNKSGVAPSVEEKVVYTAKSHGIEVVRIPYSEEVVKSYAAGRPVLELYPQSPASRALRELYSIVESL